MTWSVSLDDAVTAFQPGRWSNGLLNVDPSTLVFLSCSRSCSFGRDGGMPQASGRAQRKAPKRCSQNRVIQPFPDACPTSRTIPI